MSTSLQWLWRLGEVVGMPRFKACFSLVPMGVVLLRMGWGGHTTVSSGTSRALVENPAGFLAFPRGPDRNLGEKGEEKTRCWFYVGWWQNIKRVKQPGGWGEDRMASLAFTGAWVMILSLGVANSQNISARIGEPLVLTCKGAPRKPPQQLEWKLNTGRTEAWKILSPEGDSWESVARVLPNGSLFLPAVGIQDEGIFRCKATNRHGKEIKSNYRLSVYQIPGKPEIVDPAFKLIAGIPNKVGTCLSEGGYPAGTLSWHMDGKALVPDGKGVSVREETRRHPDTGLFTVQSELTMTPAQGGPQNPKFSCSLSLSPSAPGQRALHATPIQPSVWESLSLEEVRLVVEPEGGEVAPGGAVTLTCETHAQPPPQIHWLKDGSPLAIAPSSILIIPEVGAQDQGIYTCVATDQAHRSRESPGVNVSIIGERTPVLQSLNRLRHEPERPNFSSQFSISSQFPLSQCLQKIAPVQALWPTSFQLHHQKSILSCKDVGGRNWGGGGEIKEFPENPRNGGKNRS
ncbi:advanced glycosylation end product-specific receptor isoform X1 [Macrotis lagotis]|uniref:advanced glycosylation end product-specific receptor isoform X1 n=1 Tax=Macrotis lagotis TaxID=92651 RepID=UPI003D680A1C